MKARILAKLVSYGVTVGFAAALSVSAPAQAVLHATITVTGGVSFTGSFDQRLPVATCADAAKGGTQRPGAAGGARFYVPSPPPGPGGPGIIGSGHNFDTDAAVAPYHGPGTYTGAAIVATQMRADTPPGAEETHIFAFPASVGTLIVKPDASGSFQFDGLQDPGSIKISGKVVWTCS
jgi:hypothetical protein